MFAFTKSTLSVSIPCIVNHGINNASSFTVEGATIVTKILTVYTSGKKKITITLAIHPPKFAFSFTPLSIEPLSVGTLTVPSSIILSTVFFPAFSSLLDITSPKLSPFFPANI